ncbi:hypothetical protein FACS1894211_16440 [Clostridia bacterium]|nr:hypothetical protein FACS1894211_16440 [Clostridia bacterium]
MGEFIINPNAGKMNAIIRTIRIKGETYDKLTDLAEKHNITFNKLVNQCIEYALDNLTDKE